MLTRAELKEYSSPLILPSTTTEPPALSQHGKIILPRPKSPPKLPKSEETLIRWVSVIKRVPTKSESAVLKDDPPDAPQDVPQDVPDDECKLEIPTPEPVQVGVR